MAFAFPYFIGLVTEQKDIAVVRAIEAAGFAGTPLSCSAKLLEFLECRGMLDG